MDLWPFLFSNMHDMGDVISSTWLWSLRTVEVSPLEMVVTSKDCIRRDATSFACICFCCCLSLSTTLQWQMEPVGLFLRLALHGRALLQRVVLAFWLRSQGMPRTES
ncbi:hypothetical protein Ancab_024656 [Ancistrocladus abbreviatus]